MSPDNAPITIQDATAIAIEFFPGKNPEVLGFTLTPFSNDPLGFLATHKLLTIETQEKDSRRSLEFFVKLSKKVDSLYISNMFNREAKFFSEIVPRFMEIYSSDPWSARCFLARSDVIVLEDLRLQGFKTVSKLLNENQMMSAIAVLAHFHACSMILEKSSGKPLSQIFPEFMTKNTVSYQDGDELRFLKAGCEVAMKMNLNYLFMKPAYQIFRASYQKKGQRIVLGHNDLWFNNLMFSESNCRLLDFQFAGPVSYVTDLVQLVYLNNTLESRREMESQFVKAYHEELVKCLKSHGLEEPISLDQVVSDYEDSKVCGLVFALTIFPITLLDKKSAEKYASNMEKYLYVSRKDFVLDVIEKDDYYKCRIEESVRELIELMASNCYKNHKNRMI